MFLDCKGKPEFQDNQYKYKKEYANTRHRTTHTKGELKVVFVFSIIFANSYMIHYIFLFLTYVLEHVFYMETVRKWWLGHLILEFVLYHVNTLWEYNIGYLSGLIHSSFDYIDIILLGWLLLYPLMIHLLIEHWASRDSCPIDQSAELMQVEKMTFQFCKGIENKQWRQK